MSHEAAAAAANIRNASLSCRALGCTARKIGTAPADACVAGGCVSADYVPRASGPVKGIGFPEMTGDIAAHEPTLEQPPQSHQEPVSDGPGR